MLSQIPSQRYVLHVIFHTKLKDFIYLKSLLIARFPSRETISTCSSVLRNPTKSKPFAEFSLSSHHFPGEGQERQDPVSMRSVGRLLCILMSPPVKWAHAGPVIRGA